MFCTNACFDCLYQHLHACRVTEAVSGALQSHTKHVHCQYSPRMLLPIEWPWPRFRGSIRPHWVPTKQSICTRAGEVSRMQRVRLLHGWGECGAQRMTNHYSAAVSLLRKGKVFLRGRRMGKKNKGGGKASKVFVWALELLITHFPHYAVQTVQTVVQAVV